KELESEVHVSPSISAKTKKHDDKTNKEAKGKSPIKLSTGIRNLSEEFEDFFNNSTNEVNAASTSVPAVGQNSTNSTNTFSIVALEDITYSDDEEDVGAEADFSNLETNITKNPKGYTKLLKIPVGLKLCRRSFFNSRCKSAFLYETIEEEVYVCQPLGFEDPDYLDKVYKVAKALYRLHQAPRAWYETLANYLLENGFQRGRLIRPCSSRSKKMSSMSELTFFLGLQVKQKQDGIFISQDKYVADILRKFGLTDGKSASTPIDTEKPLLKDPDGFEKILDFLNASVIKYALTVNPSMRKLIITKDTVRQVLRLDDAKSIDCLPDEEIFAELDKIGLVRNVDGSLKFYMYPRFLQLMIATQVGDLSSHTTKYTSPALTQKVFANMRRVGKGFSRMDTPLFKGMLVPQQVNDDVADVVADAVAEDENAVEPTPPTPATTPSHQ
nr:hypothetical protein [Tanacetum cinerariifolium]